MYNKRRFNKINNEKILHKVRKHWVTVSIAMLGLIGGGAVTTTQVSANTSNHPDNNSNYQSNINELQSNSLKLLNSPQNNYSNQHLNNGIHNNRFNTGTNPNKVTNQDIISSANKLHDHILINTVHNSNKLGSKYSVNNSQMPQQLPSISNYQALHKPRVVYSTWSWNQAPNSDDSDSFSDTNFAKVKFISDGYNGNAHGDTMEIMNGCIGLNEKTRSDTDEYGYFNLGSGIPQLPFDKNNYNWNLRIDPGVQLDADNFYNQGLFSGNILDSDSTGEEYIWKHFKSMDVHNLTRTKYSADYLSGFYDNDPYLRTICPTSISFGSDAYTNDSNLYYVNMYSDNNIYASNGVSSDSDHEHHTPFKDFIKYGHNSKDHSNIYYKNMNVDVHLVDPNDKLIHDTKITVKPQNIYPNFNVFIPRQYIVLPTNQQNYNVQDVNNNPYVNVKVIPKIDYQAYINNYQSLVTAYDSEANDDSRDANIASIPYDSSVTSQALSNINIDKSYINSYSSEINNNNNFDNVTFANKAYSNALDAYNLISTDNSMTSSADSMANAYASMSNQQSQSSKSNSMSMSESNSISNSTSASLSTSASTSRSNSISIINSVDNSKAKASTSASLSASTSTSINDSISASLSVSASASLSLSTITSINNSKATSNSLSASNSASLSASVSNSITNSIQASQSLSSSLSVSASDAIKISLSTSTSMSLSTSASLSISNNQSMSASLSNSESINNSVSSSIASTSSSESISASKSISFSNSEAKNNQLASLSASTSASLSLSTVTSINDSKAMSVSISNSVKTSQSIRASSSANSIYVSQSTSTSASASRTNELNASTARSITNSIASASVSASIFKSIRNSEAMSKAMSNAINISNEASLYSASVSRSTSLSASVSVSVQSSLSASILASLSISTNTSKAISESTSASQSVSASMSISSMNTSLSVSNSIADSIQNSLNISKILASESASTSESASQSLNSSYEGKSISSAESINDKASGNSINYSVFNSLVNNTPNVSSTDNSIVNSNISTTTSPDSNVASLESTNSNSVNQQNTLSTNITNDKVDSINAPIHWLYVDTTCLAHNHLSSVGKIKDYDYVLHRGTVARIIKSFKVHHNGKYFNRYEISLNGRNYFVTSNPIFTKNEYIQPKEFNHKAVIKEPCWIHNSFKYDENNRIKKIHRGQVVHIKRIIHIGKHGHFMTRFELSNGRFITANRKFIKMM